MKKKKKSKKSDDEDTDNNQNPNVDNPQNDNQETPPVVMTEEVVEGLFTRILAKLGFKGQHEQPEQEEEEQQETPDNDNPENNDNSDEQGDKQMTREEAMALLGLDEDAINGLKEIAQQKKVKEVKTYAKGKAKELNIELPDDVEFDSNEKVDEYITFAQKLIGKNGFVPQGKVKEDKTGGSNFGKQEPRDFTKEINEAYASGNVDLAFDLMSQRDKASKQ